MSGGDQLPSLSHGQASEMPPSKGKRSRATLYAHSHHLFTTLPVNHVHVLFWKYDRPVSPQPKGASRYSRAINTYSEFDFDDETTVFSERDCLNLNIYVHEDTLKRAQETQDAAVMVYIHGGGYRDGANAMDVFGEHYKLILL